MKKVNFVVGFSLLTYGIIATSAEWQSGWGQGTSEFYVNDGQADSLYFGCKPDDEMSPVSGVAKINGTEYYSHNDRGGFDVIVDGETYSNPFYVECSACSSWFEPFYQALRKAKIIQISADGKTAPIPINGLSQLLPDYQSAENPCGTGVW